MRWIRTNRFEFWNGSEGSFRAGDIVTLGEGFWARSGSDFVAYTSNCTPIAPQPSTSPVAVNKNENEEIMIETYEIHVYPNPFSENLFIEYHLMEDSYVDISIFDLSGKLVANPLTNEFQTEGMHKFQFEANTLATGNYFCHLNIDGEVYKKKITLVK